MRNKISACLVLFNEEKNIKRCLESLASSVDEIVIIHDGKCNDRTLDIAGKYTKRIYILEHIGEAEPHRPASFKEAKYDWILQIDADEFLSEELKNNLRKLVNIDSVDAYELLWPIWDGKKYVTKKWPRKKCLFRKDKISFLGIPHYIVEVKGRVKKCDFIMEHKPDYNNLAWSIFISKWIKWSKIQARAYLKDFRDIEKYNYNSDSWPGIIKLRKRTPLLLMPFEFIVTLYKNLISGAWREGRAGFLYSLYCSIYRVTVNYYIFLYKNK